MTSKRIYKYIIEPVDFQKVHINGKILSVINQRENICMYALVDENEPERTYSIWLLGTGYCVPNEVVEKFTFLGTVPLYEGSLVLHAFYMEEEDETNTYDPERN